MKIVYVVPGPMDQQELERRGGILKKWAAQDTEVAIRRVDEGPASIESMYEEYLSIPATTELVYELEQEGFDVAILGCAGDPGLDGMREVTSKMLVVGPGQTSYQTAAMLCHRFSVITIADSMIDVSYDLGYKAGVLAKLASVRSVDVPVLELANNRDKTMEKMIKEGQLAMKEDRAQVLVLGCMSMGFLEVAEELQEELGIPVINPSRVGLAMAESLARSGLTHSKKAFTLPPKLASGKVKSLQELSVVGG